MAEVIVYTTSMCGFCVAVKRLLSQKGVAFREIDVTGDRERRAWLLQETKQRTVPQVFIDGVPHGGFSDLQDLDRRGALDRLLGHERP